MNDYNAFTNCPLCGKKNIGIKSVQVLFEDTRYDIMECSDCKAIWKTYYKVSIPKLEILKGPETTESDNDEKEAVVDENDN